MKLQARNFETSTAVLQNAFKALFKWLNTDDFHIFILSFKYSQEMKKQKRKNEIDTNEICKQT